MPTFRKRPIVITAEQYREGERGPRGVCRCSPTSGPEMRHVQYPAGSPHVHTMHGGQRVLLVDGDWVVPEPDGEHFYPIKPDVMEATYEPVDG